MAPTADHCQIDTQLSGFGKGDDNIDVFALAARNELFFLDLVQRMNLVAIDRRLLEGQPGCRFFHGLLQAPCHLLLTPEQEHGGQLHVGGIVSGRDQIDAGAAATLDLVQQTRPRTVSKDAVLTGAQAEHLLQQVNTVAHGPGRGIGTEIIGAAIGIAAEKAEPRVVAPGQDNIGVGLVVAKENVVARRQALDQVVFEQQRFGFGARRGRLDTVDLADHVRDARTRQIAPEIRGHALLEIFRLANVEHVAIFVEHAVNARQFG